MARVQQQGQKPAKSAEPVAVAEPVKSPYRYFIPGEKPRVDAAYFELLIAKLLRSNGEFPNFDEVWPVAVQSLAGMNLLRLSTYSTVELRDAIVTVGGEFNSRINPQAEAIIRWAQSFWRIRQIYGTFRRYLRSFEVDGFEALLEDLKVRLPGQSAEFITAFLRDAGEKVPVPEKASSARQQQRSGAQQDGRGNDQRRQQQQPQKQQQPQSPPQQQQQQQQQKQEGGRNDRRRRQRGRGGARPQQQDSQAQKPPSTQQQSQRQPQLDQSSQAKASAENSAGDDVGKDSQQQRRRNRRRFFRRRRSGGGGDSAGSPTAPTT